MSVNQFFAALFTEMGARRRRLRKLFGDRVQAMVEFFVLGGLLAGSAGLFVAPWMPAAAPWGFALPFVFLIGFLLIEARRQNAMALLAQAEAANPQPAAPAPEFPDRRYDDDELPWTPERGVQTFHDWAVALWALGCALAGIAAFVIAYTSDPWALPAGTVETDIIIGP